MRQRIGMVMNGIAGRMDKNQHLSRSMLAL